MKSIILLNEALKSKLASIPVKDNEMPTEEYVKKRMINAINNYNPKLKVERVEYFRYEDIKSQFPLFKEGDNHGLLVEEMSIKTLNDKQKIKFRNQGWFIDNTVGTARRIIMYLYLSDPKEGARNSFVSQRLFPELIDYIGDYIESPSSSMTNHKELFINIVPKTITAPSILRNLASFCAIGMGYIEIFDTHTLDPNEIPNDLKNFLEKYTNRAHYKNEFYDAANNIFENSFYRVEFDRKILYLKANILSDSIVYENRKYKFFGSSEKFYWVEILPISIFAHNLGYEVNYLEYEKFINDFSNKISDKNEKMKRCKIVLQYIKKYCG